MFFNIKYAKPLSFILIAVYILIPIVLLYLPKTNFDDGIITCPSKILFGLNCLGCGMTRACMRIIHFDFMGAWKYNKFSFLIFPYFGYIWVQTIINLIKRTL
ncbi:MAG: DUF2752 domain-containing protein [Cytophagales bacterium]|nr:MAG: DUF2752 domain-containing protein [Cytophagales bacterium]